MSSPRPIFSCWVPGIPRPGGSKTATVVRRKGGEIVMYAGADGKQRPLVTTRDAGGEKTANWRQNCAFFARESLGVGRDILFDRGVPFVLRIKFVMPRISSHFDSKGRVKANAPIYHTVKPDATKLLRSAEDSLTGILWHDDAACQPSVIKIYGEVPGASIELWPIEQITVVTKHAEGEWLFR